MAIVFDAKAAICGNDQGPGAHLWTLASGLGSGSSIAVGAVTSGILVMLVNPYTGSGDITAVHLDGPTGAAFTKHPTAVNFFTTDNWELWYLLQSTFDFSNGSHQPYVTSGYAMGSAILSSWSGVDQTTPFITSDGNYPPTLNALPAGGVIIDGWGETDNEGPPYPSQDVTQTLLFGDVDNLNGCVASASYKASAGGSDTMAWTNGSGAYAAWVLNPASGGGGAAAAILDVYDPSNNIRGWFDPTQTAPGWYDEDWTLPVATGAPRSTIRGGLPPAGRWVGYAALLVPAIQGPLVTGAPRKTIAAAVPITRPWVGYAKNLKPAIRGKLVTGAPRDTIKAGLGNGLAIVRWSPYGAKLLDPAIRGPLVPGSPRDTIHGAIPITRPWIGYAVDLKPAIRGKLVNGPPRAVIRAGVPIVPSRSTFFPLGRIFEARAGVVATSTGVPRKTTAAGIPPARRWVGFAQLLRPAVRGPLVTGGPRETIRAGPGNGFAITRWAPYGARVIEPAIRGPLVSGARRSTIVGAIAIARPRVPFARVITHAAGGKVIAGSTTLARGLPITRRWVGFALDLRPAIRGPLVTGAPTKTVRGAVAIALSRVALSPVARVFEARTGSTAAPTTGAPRKTTLGAIPIARRWTGFAIIGRPSIRGALVTGTPRKNILGRVPIVRPWIGYAQDLKPAIRGKLVAGSPRDIIRGAIAIVRAWPGVAHIFTHARGGKVVAGTTTTAHGIEPGARSLRAISPSYPRRVFRGNAGMIGRAAIVVRGFVSPRRFFPWSSAVTQTGQQIGRIAGVPRHTVRGALAIVRPWFGTDRLFAGRLGRTFAFKTPHYLRAALDAGPRVTAELQTAPRLSAALGTSPRLSSDLSNAPRATATIDACPRITASFTINGVVAMPNTLTPVRINASNILTLAKLTDMYAPTTPLTGVSIAVRILRTDGSELTPTTALPVNPNQAGQYAVSLSKTDAAFVKGERYIAQFSGTGQDANSVSVDYYEELELIGTTH